MPNGAKNRPLPTLLAATIILIIGFGLGKMFPGDHQGTKALEMAGIHKTLFEGKNRTLFKGNWKEEIIRVGITENILTSSNDPVAIPGTNIRKTTIYLTPNNLTFYSKDTSHIALIFDPRISDQEIQATTSVKTVYYSRPDGYTFFFLIE